MRGEVVYLYAFDVIIVIFFAIDLIGLFLITISLIAWGMWPLSAEQMYERGAKLMASSDPDGLRASVAEAVPFLGFRVGRVLSAANLDTPEGRARAAEQAIEVVREHPNELVDVICFNPGS